MSDNPLRIDSFCKNFRSLERLHLHLGARISEDPTASEEGLFCSSSFKLRPPRQFKSSTVWMRDCFGSRPFVFLIMYCVPGIWLIGLKAIQIFFFKLNSNHKKENANGCTKLIRVFIEIQALITQERMMEGKQVIREDCRSCCKYYGE